MVASSNKLSTDTTTMGVNGPGLSNDPEVIAKAVSVPIGTVRSRIHRGRRMMREILT